jgi:hypothetical protein
MRGIVKKCNRPLHEIRFFLFHFVILTDRHRFTVWIRLLDLVPVARGSMWSSSDFHWCCAVFWGFLHKISSNQVWNLHKMLELGEIFHLARRCQGKKVGNLVIPSIYGPKPTIFGDIGQNHRNSSVLAHISRRWQGYPKGRKRKIPIFPFTPSYSPHTGVSLFPLGLTTFLPWHLRAKWKISPSSSILCRFQTWFELILWRNTQNTGQHQWKSFENQIEPRATGTRSNDLIRTITDVYQLKWQNRKDKIEFREGADFTS